LYLDERFSDVRTPNTERIIEFLGRLADKSIDQPDAGLWEIRGGEQIHSFTNLMCWTALRSLELVRSKGHLHGVREKEWKKAADRAEQALRNAVKDGVLYNGPKDKTLDASLLQLALFGFPDKEVVRNTVQSIRENLSIEDGFLYRYKREDDFGTPESAFMICSFWMVQALVAIDRREEAFELLKHVTTSGNHLMLFSEHYDPKHRRQLGNFPQAYSHVGMINAAFAACPSWHEFLSGEEKK
jgi:GH15 family glucan-1,4-alpha-glucosidase